MRLRQLALFSMIFLVNSAYVQTASASYLNVRTSDMMSFCLSSLYRGLAMRARCQNFFALHVNMMLHCMQRYVFIAPPTFCCFSGKPLLGEDVSAEACSWLLAHVTGIWPISCEPFGTVAAKCVATWNCYSRVNHRIRAVIVKTHWVRPGEKFADGVRLRYLPNVAIDLW